MYLCVRLFASVGTFHPHSVRRTGHPNRARLVRVELDPTQPMTNSRQWCLYPKNSNTDLPIASGFRVLFVYFIVACNGNLDIH